MTFINTAAAALRTLWLAVIGIIPMLLRDVGTLGAALGGPNRPDGRTTATAATRLAAAVVVVLLVYPALRNVYVMEFITNPAIARANQAKAEADATIREGEAWGGSHGDILAGDCFLEFHRQLSSKCAAQQKKENTKP